MSSVLDDHEADLAAAKREALALGADVAVLLDDNQAAAVSAAFAELTGTAPR